MTAETINREDFKSPQTFELGRGTSLVVLAVGLKGMMYAYKAPGSFSLLEMHGEKSVKSFEVVDIAGGVRMQEVFFLGFPAAQLGYGPDDLKPRIKPPRPRSQTHAMAFLGWAKAELGKR